MFNVISSRQLLKFSIVLLSFAAIWIDTLYGVFAYVGLEPLKVSLLYRLVIIMFAGIVILWSRHWLSYLCVILMFLWSLVSWWNAAKIGDVGLVNSINNVVRLVFPFALALLIFTLINREKCLKELLLKGLAHYGWIFGIFVIFSFVTGVGLLSYGDHAFGTKSFYVAGNDIGLTALMSLVVQLSLTFKQGSLSNWLKVLLTTTGLLLLGTKTSWAGTILMLSGFTAVFIFFKSMKNITGLALKGTVLACFLSVVAGGALFIQQNYDELQYQLSQFEQILQGKSPRADLVQAAERVIEEQPNSVLISGLGQTFNRNMSDEFFLYADKTDHLTDEKIVEADWYDIKAVYGIPFAAFIVSMHVMMLIFSIWLFMSMPSVLRLSSVLVCLLFNAHAFLAGHAYMSSQVGGFVGMIYGLLLVSLMERRWLTGESYARSQHEW